MSETTRSAPIDGAPARASLLDWLAVAAGTIGTFYLVAEIVVIPLIAWLERLLGLRRLPPVQ